MADKDEDQEKQEIFQVISDDILKEVRKRHEVKKNLQPDEYLEEGMTLPVMFANKLPTKLIGTPVKDLDEFYQEKETFMVVNKRNTIFRFNVNNSMYMFSPTNSIRSKAIRLMVHPWFMNLIIITIVIHNIFDGILPKFGFVCMYTIEMLVKIIARGFVTKPFTYLRNGWNWLDFASNIILYFELTFTVYTSLTFLRLLRLLREIKPKPVVPGIKNMEKVLRRSLWSLKSVIIFTFFVLTIISAYAIRSLGGTLKNKCVAELNLDGLNLTLEETRAVLFEHNNNSTNWKTSEISYIYKLCGFSTCPVNYSCVEIGNNPNYGYATFDSFTYSLLSTFRVMLQDYWELLYQQTIATAGPALSLSYFFCVFFLGSYCLLHLILATVVVTYSKMHRKAQLSQVQHEKVDVPKQQDDKNVDHTNINGHQVDTEFPNGESSHVTDVIDSNEDETRKPKFQSKVHDFCCLWNCCSCCVKLQRFLSVVVNYPYFELFINLSLIVYATLAIFVSHRINSWELVYLIFGLIFLIEAILKLLALGPKKYFKNDWNTFSFILVLIVTFEATIMANPLHALDLFLFRLLRLFIFVRAKPKFKILLSTGKSSRAMMHITYALIIFINAFAYIGFHLFSNRMHQLIDISRWNFVDHQSSLYHVFRMVCGEWIELLWDCMHFNGWICLPYFFTTFVICNLVLLNLYLAVVIFSPANGEISDYKNDDDMKRLSKAIGSTLKALKTIKIGARGSKLSSDTTETVELQNVSNDQMKSPNENMKSKKEATDREKTAPRCLSNCCYIRLPWFSSTNTPFWNRWGKFRNYALKVAESIYFEIFIGVFIFFSCIVVAITDQYSSQRLISVLPYIRIAFFIVSSIEAFIRLVGMGIKKYFTNFLCCIEFAILMALFLEFVGCLLGAFGPFFGHHNSLWSLRCLRFLKSLSRWKSIRVVMNTLVKALPSIFYVVLFGLVYCLVVAILGVHYMHGRFYKCMEREKNFYWINSDINFDNVANSLLALFQVATLSGWLPTVYTAVDKEKNQTTDGHQLTKEQRKLSSVFQKLADRKPIPIKKSKSQLQSLLQTLVTNPKFDMVINFLIFLNVMILAGDYYDNYLRLYTFTTLINLILTVTFTIECGLKIYALRGGYFKDHWNRFDFAVVLLAIADTLVRNLAGYLIIDAIHLRTARLASLTRTFRSVKLATGIRTLFLALKKSLPFIASVFILLFHIIFIYAIFGMRLFHKIASINDEDRSMNFETFSKSFLVLFQLSTSNGWDQVLKALTKEPYCQNVDSIDAVGCENIDYGTVVFYLVSYVTVSFIIVSLSIPAVINSYIEAVEEVDEGITNDDFDKFYDVWQRFDQDNTHYIANNQLPELLNALEPHFHITDANDSKIISMNIPICKGNKCHQVDILEALIEDIFLRKRNLNGEASNDDDDKIFASSLRLHREEFSAKFIKKPWSKFYENKVNDVNEGNSVDLVIADNDQRPQVAIEIQ
ncbi:hypothetical protein CHUAL_001395 [Chamberlinius hualienensis]